MMAAREAGFSIRKILPWSGMTIFPLRPSRTRPWRRFRSHAFEQGKVVGEATIALVNGKKIGRHQSVLPLELTIRESCGARR
jgi:DNA-binding LacI/PurR family transcriptional regulator